MLRRTLMLLLVAAPAMAGQGPVTGLPLPREATVSSEASLRERPSIDGAILTSLAAGSSVLILEEHENWRRVRIDGRDGWIHRALLRP